MQGLALETPVWGGALEVRCGPEGFPADDVETEAKTDCGPFRRPSIRRAREAPTPP